MAFILRAHPAARMMRAVCILSLLAILFFIPHSPWLATAVAAQPAAISTPAGTPTPAMPKPEVRPLWTELTPAQQQVLAPLAAQWGQLDNNHKVKWIAISNKYPSMTPEQQARLHANIAEWAKLTPEQHRLARESYAKAKKLNPEQKTAQWEQYQQLPEEQKQKLAADAASKKRIANVPSLQSKPKTVEPLKASKKASAASSASATGVPASKPPVPTGTAPISSSAPVPQPGLPIAPAPNINK
ncbi:MAG TPA: DUF3106 domain-containing protein [Burkholderiaceae bacterium]|jgi:hypothetical protein